MSDTYMTDALRGECAELRAKLAHAEKEEACWKAVAEVRLKKVDELQAKLAHAEAVAVLIIESLARVCEGLRAKHPELFRK